MKVPVKRSSFKTPLTAFFITVIVLSVMGIFYLLYEAKMIREDVRNNLSMIADTKAKKIFNWNKERREDARQIRDTSVMQRIAIQYLQGNETEAGRRDIIRWMLSFQRQFDYEWVALLDRDGKTVLSVPPRNEHLSDFHHKYVEEVLKTKSIYMADMHRDVNDDGNESDRLHFSYWIPVIDPEQIESPIYGIWVTLMDPERFILPLVQSWPVLSKTAETLMIRREGEEVVYINEPRHIANKELQMRFNISSYPHLPAVQALMGKEDIVDGIDYRGVEVLADIRKVPDSPWYLVTKIDKNELYQPLRDRLYFMLLLALILILTIAMGVGFFERKRDSEWLKQQLGLEQEKLRLQDNYQKIANEWVATFDSIDDVIWVLDTNHTILRSNKASEKLLDIPVTELIGKHCYEVFHHTDRPDVDCPFNTLLQRNDKVSIDVRYKDKWLSTSVEPIHSADGTLIGGVHILRDITQKKLDEIALTESETRFRELFEHMSLGVSIYKQAEDGKDFIIQDINLAGQMITQSVHDEIIGRRASEVFPDLVSSGLIDLFHEVNQTGRPASMETHRFSGDKLVYWLDNYVLKLGTGELIALYDDISEVKTAELAIRNSEVLLREIIDHAPYGAHTYKIMDGERIVLVEANLSASKILSLDHSNLIGLEAEDAFPSLKGTGVPERYLKVARGEGSYDDEELFYEDDRISGAFEIHAIKTGHEMVTVFFRDVTEKRKAEEAIIRINEELESKVLERTSELELANKELEAFTYSVSHDLRSPLRGIAGWALALTEDYQDKLDDQGKDYLSRINSETVRMSTLIEALLKLSRISKVTLSKEEVNLSILAREILDRLQSEHPDRKVEQKIEDGLIAQGDQNLLEIALTNLLNNAWKFTGKKSDACIEMYAEQIDEENWFVIRDNGAGFNMEIAHKLFGAFQRMHTNRDFPGTGIGLATVKRIIERHGGQIQAEASPEEGAKFSFKL